MKKIISFILIILIAPINSFAFLPNNFLTGPEPDGFRGIKWGTNIKNLDNFFLVNDPLSKTYDGILKKYQKENDLLRIGSANIEKIEYLFWENKFYFAYASFSGGMNWKALRDSCFRMFGPQKIKIKEMSGKRNDGTDYREQIEEYEWEGKITELQISYWHILNFGTFTIASKLIGENARSFQNKKARERAGF